MHQFIRTEDKRKSYVIWIAYLLLAILVLAILVFSCTHFSNNKKTITPAINNPAVWTFTEINEANLTKAVEALPEIIIDTMRKTGVPGIAVAVVRSDKILLTAGFGVRSVDSAEPVDANTVFQLASLSKPIGATVVSRAVSNGAVAWNDPVQKHLPWFRMGQSFVTKHVTLADMYAHRSGLPDHAGDLLEDLGFGRDEILRRLQFLPTGPFRNQYAYTNFGLTAAAEAVAKALHGHWAQLSEDLLYQPAGMISTSSRYADYLATANRAANHQHLNHIWTPGPPRNPDPESPAGGVSSNAKDMAKWMQLQLGNGTLDGKELIKADIIQIMRQPHSISNTATNPQARSSMYGFGMGTVVDSSGHVRWSHSGAFLLGVASNVVFIPSGNIGITVLSNGEPHGIPEAISAQFADILETGKIQQDWLTLYENVFASFYNNPSKLAGKPRPQPPTPPEPLSHYTGTYANHYYGTAQITATKDKLVLALGPLPEYFKLTHWNGNTFSYFPRGENALGITAVSFDCTARTLTIENLDENGLGTFWIQEPG